MGLRKYLFKTNENIKITIPTKIAVLKIKVFLSLIADLISLAFSEIARYPILFPSNITLFIFVYKNRSYPSCVKVYGLPLSLDCE